MCADFCADFCAASVSKWSLYIFDAAIEIEGANPGPIAVCPRTEAMLHEHDGLKSRLVEQMGPLPPKTTSPPAHVANVTHTSGEAAPAGVSASRTERLPCSLVLGELPQYAALHDKRAKKEVVAAEEERIGANRSSVPKNRRRAASRTNDPSSAGELE